MDSSPEISDTCKICMNECDYYDNPAIRCEGKCQQKIHVKCLQRGALPSNFVGDVFYDLFCTECSDSDEEFLIRQKLSWLTAVILTMYNLREKSKGISRRGYFHWKSDISMFINTQWDQLFGKTVKQKKNWIGTVSGTLSHYSGIFFKSGTAELGDQGWWKLIDNDPPQVLVNKYYKVLELKKQNQTKLKAKSNNKVQLQESIISYDHKNENNKNNKNNGYEDYKIDKPVIIQYETETNNFIPKSISACEDFGDILDLDIDMPSIEDDFPSFNLAENAITEELPFQDCNNIPRDIEESVIKEELVFQDCINIPPDIEESVIKEELQFQEYNDIPLLYSSDVYEKTSEASIKEPANNDTNISDAMVKENLEDVDEILNIESDIDEELLQETDTIESNKTYDLPPPEPSLFTQSVPRPWPFDESIKFDPDKVRPLMSEREEEFLLQKIEKYKHLLDSAPVTVRRLYRKLVVRKIKRQYGLPLLNIDNVGKKAHKNSTITKRKGNSVLDRFITEDLSIFFEQRLCGHCEPTSVHSPYTNRLLKPFIRRDTSCCPLWLSVMNELLTKVNRKKIGWKLRSNAPIDYSYIRPQHVPAINSLCRQFFWPGVDLTECLQYPDFTCVVLYKKLVIGFAIMVPDVGYNEAYISFLLVRPEWQKSGIGTFMLYHLIQTCMGKDITLHVSASNPALILYQKFGFKQEEFIQDFYDKYIPPSSNESKHASFLRLSR